MLPAPADRSSVGPWTSCTSSRATAHSDPGVSGSSEARSLPLSWDTPEALEAGRAIAAWTSHAAGTWKAASSATLHARLVKAVLEVVARYEERKKERGVLDFLDLLIKARDALRGSEAVRRYFRERLRVVRIDEFQDTSRHSRRREPITRSTNGFARQNEAP